MNLLSFLSAASAASSTALGFFVVARNPRALLNRVFLLFSLSVAYLAFTEFGYRQSEGPDSALLWLKLSQLSPLTVALMLAFACVYAGRLAVVKDMRAMAALFGPAVAFAGLDLATDAISGGPVRTAWGWTHTIPANAGYHLYEIWSAAAYFFTAAVCVRHHARQSDARRRVQSRYVVLGLLAACLLGLITEDILPYAGLQFPELTTLGFVIANALIAYAMWRHELFMLTPGAAADRIVETMSDALFLVDTQGTVQTANASAARLLECRRDDIVGASIGAAITGLPPLPAGPGGPADAAGVRHDLAATARTFSGTLVPLSLSLAAMRDTRGAPQGTVVIARDITERAAAQTALQVSRERLEERVAERTAELARANARLAEEKEWLAVTLGSIGDGVIATDVRGMVLTVNKIAENLTGWSSNEAAGRPIGEVLRMVRRGNRAQPLDPVGDVLRSGEKVDLAPDALLISRTGAAYRIEDSCAPIKGAAGRVIGAAIVFRDVTEKERLEEELFRAKRLESLGMLAGGIAHDLNNLLTGIFNELFLVRMAVHDNRDARELIDEAERAANRAQRLAGQLLTFAHGGEPIRIAGSVRTLIEESVGFLLSGSNCDYELEFEPDLPLVEMDKGQIDQVIANLVVNAREAMPGGGRIRVSVCSTVVGPSESGNSGPHPGPAALPAGAYVCVTVRDNGPGIPAGDRDRIFDPFYTTKGSGRGLGLSIAYSIARKHGGCIRVESEEGTGSAFLLYLPAARAGAEEQPDGNAPAQPVAAGAGERILVMDDERIIRTTVKSLLRRLGYRAVTAADGQEAFDLYLASVDSGRPLDLAILDLTVPGGMGGKECAALLRQLNPAVKVIVSSGYSQDAAMASPAENGFTGVLRKPYSMEALAAAVRGALGR